MPDLESLSDKELRRQLVACGLPDIPVTETTRKVILKKLKQHLENEKKQKALARKSRNSSVAFNANGYDRPQEYPHGGNIGSVSNHNHNLTSPITASRNYEYDNSEPLITTRRATVNSGIATGSIGIPTSVNVINPIISNRISGRPLINTTTPTQAPKPASTSSKMYTPPPILASDSEEDTDFKTYLNSSKLRQKYSFKNRIETPNYSPILCQVQQQQHQQQQQQQNQHCGVVSRLLSFRGTTLGNRQQPTIVQPTYQPLQHAQRFTNSSDESDGSPNRLSIAGRRSYRPPSSSSSSKTFWNKAAAILKFPLLEFKQISVPHALLGAFMIFFLVIAFFYIIKSPDLPNLIHENNTAYIQCKEGQHNATNNDKMPPLSACLDNETLAAGIALSRELITLLQMNAERHHCADQNQQATVTTHDLMRYLYEKGHDVDVRKTLRQLQATVYLINRNPHWNIGIVDTQGTAAKIDDVDELSPNKDTHFILIKPNLPISCVLRKKMHRFFVIIGTGTLLIATLIGAFLILRYITKRRQERLAAIEQFTQDIINELIYHASQTDVPENKRDIITLHLRDKLIPLNKRKSLVWAWNEALRQLRTNDSRVKFGLVQQDGEEFECVRWMGNIMSDTRDLSYRKQWQSPAFDTGNKISNPPTPCLKIRHMFDATEVNHPNLKQIIEEAILEKVGPRCNITDIQLERQSCCVYVRCATEADAGIVHNEINGWWFDKRLVSIKFLRLQRYLSRFPKST